jgi:hypothetical protein
VLLPEDDEPRDDFEPALDDFEDPPDLDPDADLFDEDPPERPFEDDLVELLLEEPLFEVADREVPPLDEDDRELPLLDEEEEPLRFDEAPEALLPDELLRLDPDDEPDELLRFAPEEEPDELLRFDPDDELLLPPADLLPDEREDEPLFDEDFERPFPPLALLRDVDDPPDFELRDPPREERPPAPAVSAIVDCTTFAAPSTAPIAAPAISVPAASAALASKPSFLRLLPLRDELDDRFDEVLFFPFVVAIYLPLARL